MATGFTVKTAGATGLVAAAAKTLVNSIPGANRQCLVCEISNSFDGVTAPAVPALSAPVGPTQANATWRTWDEPDRQVAVAQLVERKVSVVFPLTWAAHHGQPEMIARSKERIAEVEGKSGKKLAEGSVLLAYSRHEFQLLDPRDQRVINPDVIRDLRSMDPHHPMDN